MNLWLLIPVKPFRESKTRLSPLLDAGQRAALSRQLLDTVIHQAQESRLFAQILVVSRDPSALAIARQKGAESLEELDGGEATEPESGLNRALSMARARAGDAGARAVLILPADLPLLTVEDLHALVAPLGFPPRADADPRPPAGHNAASHARVVVLAPSHDMGTNALLLAPPDLIPFAFGPQSFDRHRELAQAANAAVVVVQTPTLTYDLDLPEDLWGEELGI